MVLFLVCALLGTVLLFGHGFDVGRRFVNYPSFVCAIPFAIPLPALLLIEKTRAESGYALSAVPSNYQRILTAALIVESVASAIGLTILLLGVFHVWTATEDAFGLPIMGLFFIPGQLTYFIMCLVGLSNDENAKGVFLLKILSIGFLVGSLLAAAGTIVSGEQWSFFYLVSPMSLLVAVMAEESPAENERRE